MRYLKYVLATAILVTTTHPWSQLADSGADYLDMGTLTIATVGQWDGCVELRNSTVIDATNGSWVIDKSEPTKKEMLATALAAKASGSRILIHWVKSMSGCNGTAVRVVIRTTVEL